MALVLVGILLFFVGMMISTSIIFIEKPSYTDYSDYDAYEEALDDYYKQVKNIRGAGSITIELSGMLACIGLFGGAIDNKAIDVNVKVGFISGGISFLITVMIILGLFGG